MCKCVIQKNGKPHAYSNKIKNQHKIRGVFDNLSQKGRQFSNRFC